jgi:hypothetical protein
MSVASTDYTRILALLATLGTALLAWAGAQFGGLPSRVTTLEAKATMEGSRLDRIENKLDKIFEAVKR